MIPIQQALDGVAAFAVNDVISEMPNTIGKFVALMAVGSMRNNPAQFLKPYESTIKAFGIMNEDGSAIDEVNLKAALEEAFTQMPKVSWMGFTFSASDATKLLTRMGA